MPPNDSPKHSPRVSPYRKPSPRQCRIAFESVLKVYLPARLAPVTGSSMATLDPEYRAAYPRWRPEFCHICIDVERAVRSGLKNDPVLLERFTQGFIMPEVDPLVSEPPISGVYAEIVQRCGAAFIKRGLYPLWKWLKPSALVADIEKRKDASQHEDETAVQ